MCTQPIQNIQYSEKKKPNAHPSAVPIFTLDGLKAANEWIYSVLSFGFQFASCMNHCSVPSSKCIHLFDWHVIVSENRFFDRCISFASIPHKYQIICIKSSRINSTPLQMYEIRWNHRLPFHASANWLSLMHFYFMYDKIHHILSWSFREQC